MACGSPCGPGGKERGIAQCGIEDVGRATDGDGELAETAVDDLGPCDRSEQRVLANAGA